MSFEELRVIIVVY
jgi:hypothetical protein